MIEACPQQVMTLTEGSFVAWRKNVKNIRDLRHAR
jgi:hypothetical protein